MTVLTEAPTAGELALLSDVVPGLGGWLGLGADAAAAFTAAAGSSAGASIREALVFEDSAAEQLGGLELTAIPAFATIDAASERPRKTSLAGLATQYAAFHRLVPKTGDVVAAWLVDPDTGSLTAVGADGQGAGKDCSKLPPTQGLERAGRRTPARRSR
ncbi:MAG: hypothetical protein U0838_15800 [Chloroflexota bacterium]